MRTMTWVDVNGVSTVLDGSAGIMLLADPVGLEAPNPHNVVDDYVAFDGGILTNRRMPARSIALALYLEHPTRVQTVVAQTAKMLQGPGQLQWADETGIRALRQVIYEAGLDGSGDTNLTQRNLVVSLLALDPWVYGLAASQLLSQGTVTPFDAALSFNSFAPFDGGAAATANIAGDVEAYPVITVTGPVDTLTIGSGGLFWATVAPLTQSDILIVDHRPSSRGPSKNGGAVDWSLLSEASRLFPLAVGITPVITGTAGTTVDTKIQMAWEPRWLTP